MRPLHEYRRCHHGEPCQFVCLDRAREANGWEVYLREPQLASLWSGTGEMGPPLDLPDVIPSGGLRVRLPSPAAPWVAVDACDLFTLTPGRCMPKRCAESPGALRAALGVPAATRVLVYLNAPDAELEGLFSGGGLIAQVVANVQPDLVGAPSFSLYDSRPGIDQVYQQQRMFTVLGELERAGVPVFPNVYVASDADVRRWQEWLVARGGAWAVGSVVQSMDPPFFTRTVRALASLQAACEREGRRLRVVLYGLSSPERVLAVRELGLAHFTCVSSNPAMTASHGRRLASNGPKFARIRDRTVDRDALFAANFGVETRAIRDAMHAPAHEIAARRTPRRDPRAAPRAARPRTPCQDPRQLSLFGQTGANAA